MKLIFEKNGKRIVINDKGKGINGILTTDRNKTDYPNIYLTKGSTTKYFQTRFGYFALVEGKFSYENGGSIIVRDSPWKFNIAGIWRKGGCYLEIHNIGGRSFVYNPVDDIANQLELKIFAGNDVYNRPRGTWWYKGKGQLMAQSSAGDIFRNFANNHKNNKFIIMLSKK